MSTSNNNKSNEEIVEELEKLMPDDLNIDYDKPYKEILKPTLYSEELWPESMLEIDSYKLTEWLRTILTLKDQAHKVEVEVIEQKINNIILDMEQQADERGRRSDYSRKVERIRLLDYIESLNRVTTPLPESDKPNVPFK